MNEYRDHNPRTLRNILIGTLIASYFIMKSYKKQQEPAPADTLSTITDTTYAKIDTLEYKAHKPF